MMRKRWHAIAVAVAVGVVATLAVGASSGPDWVEFWTGELLAWVVLRPLSDTMYWRVAEGVTVAVMALPGLVPALLVVTVRRAARRFVPVAGRRGAGPTRR